jgi:hypothetical protein
MMVKAVQERLMACRSENVTKEQPPTLTAPSRKATILPGGEVTRPGRRRCCRAAEIAPSKKATVLPGGRDRPIQEGDSVAGRRGLHPYGGTSRKVVRMPSREVPTKTRRLGFRVR